MIVVASRRPAAAPAVASRSRPASRPAAGSRNGSHWSANTPANRMLGGVIAASAMGTGTLGGQPSRRARRPSATSGSRPPLSSARTATTVSCSFAPGRCQRCPWKPSVIGAVPAPKPRTNRPPEARCSSLAVRASVAGVRPHTDSTPLTKPIRSVSPASRVSTIGASKLIASATPTETNPRRSASNAVRSITSTRSSNGVNPTPIDIPISPERAFRRPSAVSTRDGVPGFMIAPGASTPDVRSGRCSQWARQRRRFRGR